MADILLENVIKIYGAKINRKTKEIPEGKRAVDNLSVLIPSGSFTVLLGPSGCGKITLLRLIAGLEDITSGTIKMGDIDITNLDPGDRGLAMVFQNYALYPHMSVRANIEFGLKNARLPNFEIKERTDDALKLVGLTEFQNRRPAYLSGGQRQRVALARAIAKRPQCFLMDEPLSNLDAKLRSEMRAELIELHKELHSTFVYVTHDQIEAMTMGDHIVVMNEGKIIQEGGPSEIYNNPNCTFVAKFIGDPGMNIIQFNDKYQYGFRPRDVNFNSAVTDENCIKMKGKILGIENHGSEFVYSLNIQGSHIYVKELSKKMRALNSEIAFSITKDNLYFFDINGQRITDQKLIEGLYGKLKSNW